MCSLAAGTNGTHTGQDQRRKAKAQRQGYQASTAIWQDDRAEAAAAPAGPSASGAFGEDTRSAAYVHLFHRLMFSLILVQLLECSCWCSKPIAALANTAVGELQHAINDSSLRVMLQL